MSSLKLTKANASALIIKCGKPANYYKYELVNFNKSIMYTFQDPVNLKQCLYDLLISNISDNDLTTLNELFVRVNSTMKIKETLFIKSKEEVQYEKAMRTVEIFGYKSLEDIIKPLWKIKSIKNFIK